MGVAKTSYRCGYVSEIYTKVGIILPQVLDLVGVNAGRRSHESPLSLGCWRTAAGGISASGCPKSKTKLK